MKKITGYETGIGQNGMKIVKPESTPGNELHYTIENSKLGLCLNIGFSIENTCMHNCECYSEKLCYGCHGCFTFGSNLAFAANNYRFIKTHTKAEIVEEFKRIIDGNPYITDFRYFEIGDIPNREFLEIMIETCKYGKAIEFWAYTKKYHIVNRYVDDMGLNAIPKNLVIVFSHWKNRDGSYYPMKNPYKFPTSEFLPVGSENESVNYTHVCPCSNPDYIGHCTNGCDHPCKRLKHGESMVLLEHSTSASAKRDKELSAIRKAQKAQRDAMLKEQKATAKKAWRESVIA